MSVLELEA